MSSRERIYRVEAIVLRRVDFGEADRLLTVFTPDRGKLRLIAKGARKPSSRKSGHVELFTHDQFLVTAGRELDIIIQAETAEAFLPLREDLLRTTYAYYVAELADAFSAERDENQPLFYLLRDTLSWLCTADDLALLARYYELRLLGVVGYQPQLFLCGNCRRELGPGVHYLAAGEGSVLCPQCGRDRAGTVGISANALKVLRFLQTHDWEICRLVRLSSPIHAEIERTMRHYLFYHLERKLKSVDLIHRLRRQMEMNQV
ncbi:MAG: DNA repair protein RecO [Anaerolineae bacterium]